MRTSVFSVWRLAFAGFPLTELGNGFGGLPERIVQGSVELWGVINRSCFRTQSGGTRPSQVKLRRSPQTVGITRGTD